MQPGIILILLAAWILAQAAPHATVPNAAYRTAACGLLMALVVIVARFVAVAAAAGLRGGNASAWAGRYRRLRSLHAAAWVLALAAIYAGLGWSQIVRENWGLRRFPLIDDLMVLLPVLLSLLLIWWAHGAADSATGNAPGRSWSARKPVLRSARHLLAPVLAPLLLMLGVQDALEFFRGPEPATPAMQAAAGIPCLLLVMAGFPLALRYLWHTEPLNDSALRRRLDQVQQRLDVRTRDTLVWHTDRTICNAVVVGMLPGCRYVLLSDLLLDRLSPDQIAAIYGHELGHIRHGHLWLRMLAVVLPIGVACLFHAKAGEWIAAASAAMHASGTAGSWQSVGLALAAIVLYVRFPFSWYCRALERQADLCGCEAAAEDGDRAKGIGSTAVKRFVSALATLSSSDHRSRQAARNGWLHPSLADRAAFVRSMGTDIPAQRRFARRMRRLAWLLIGLVSLVALLAVAS